MINFFKNLFKKEPKLTVEDRLDDARMELQEAKNRLMNLMVHLKQSPTDVNDYIAEFGRVQLSIVNLRSKISDLEYEQFP